MIVAPHIFGDIEGQPLAANTTLGSQPPLEIPPEAFEAVDVRPLATAKLALVVLHQPMDVAVGRNAGIEPQGVGTHNRATPYLAPNQRKQGLDRQIRDHLRPDLSATTQNAKDRRLHGSTAMFAAERFASPAPIAPATADISLVHFDGALKKGRHLRLQPGAQVQQGSQDPLAMQAGCLRNRRGTEPLNVASQQPRPLMPRQAQRQPGPPIVPTAGAATPIAAQDPDSRVLASRTLQASRHQPSLPE